MPSTSEPTHYDAVIVGGGVCGAIIARQLAKAKKRVLVLEAGLETALDPRNYDTYLNKFYAMGESRAAPNGPYPVNQGALSPNDSAGDPYFVQAGSMPFRSDYLRMLGGTTLHWQGTSLRMLPNDFQMQTKYGQASDWPITYDDLEPYYRDAERELGVSADVEDQQYLGLWFAPGYVYPMSKLPQSLVDRFMAAKLNGAKVALEGNECEIRVTSLPVARNSNPNPKYDGGRGYQPMNAVGLDEMGGRCQGNSSCSPICPVQAKYNAMKTMNAAMQSGVEVRSRSVASQLIIDSMSGRITGVQYKRYSDPGKTEYTTEEARGTIIILTANAIENAVLLLASDVKDESGQLGCNLMDHPYLNFFGLSPEPVFPFRGPDLTSSVESLRDGPFRSKHASFRSGIGNWGWNGEPQNTMATLLGQKKFGAALRQELRYTMTRMIKCGMMVEQLPDPKNRVTIDASKKDALGNYVPVLTYDYAAYTLDGAVAAVTKVWPKFLERSGMQDRTDPQHPPANTQVVTHNGVTFSFAGSGHLVGTHRMGSSPKNSVISRELRSWAHENLYVVGPGSMVTIGTSNPTLTSAALSFRTAENVLHHLKSGHSGE